MAVSIPLIACRAQQQALAGCPLAAEGVRALSRPASFAHQEELTFVREFPAPYDGTSFATTA